MVSYPSQLILRDAAWYQDGDGKLHPIETCDGCALRYVVFDKEEDFGLCATCQCDENAFNSWASHEFGDK